VVDLLQAGRQGFLDQVVCKHAVTAPRQRYPEQALAGSRNLFALAVYQAKAFDEFHTV
jgi:hypothetical protein